MNITPKFPLGQIVSTPGALAAFPEPFLQECLARHAQGDWGDLCADDKETNDAGLVAGAEDQLLSSYKREGRKLWIITEWDRSVTTLLLPEER